LVDLSEIQAAYYMVAATGVLIAAVFYILNLREQRKNMRLTLEARRIGVVENMMSTLISYDGGKIWTELLNYQWKDYDDFEKKYGSDVNEDSCAKRYFMWNQWNSVGSMLRKGMAEPEDLYDIGAQMVLLHWPKWKPIIEEVRRRYFGMDYLKDFEYLHGEIMKVKLKRDPTYGIPETLSKYISEK
jgi:hypothetical protein